MKSKHTYAVIAAVAAFNMLFTVWSVWGSLGASPLPWNSTFETSMPANSDPASQGAAHIRQTKYEARRRAGVEHDWGTFDNVITDTGRHLLGSARAFVGVTRPTVDGTISALCLPEADSAGNRGCDGGRLSFLTTDNSLAVALDAGADGDADSWQRVKVAGSDVTDATTTPAAGKIPVADGSGKLADGWISASSIAQHGVPVKLCDVAYTTATTLSCNWTDVGYKSYVVNVGIAATTSNLFLRTDFNGGASFDTGATDYDSVWMGMDNTGAFTSSLTSNSSAIFLSAFVGLATDWFGEIRIAQPGTAGVLRPELTWTLAGGVVSVGHGTRTAGGAINAIQFLGTGADNITGAFQVYGNL